MIRVSPGSTYACECVNNRLVSGGPAIKKCDVYEHSARLAILNRAGMKTWKEYKEKQREETESWWKEFMKDEK